ncbi:MAG: hypothetical protein QOJ55_1149 [Solirubrobacteraceae bacterium]|nr:hypothetical protein [Solirubrobacteraceae bacterium]
MFAPTLSLPWSMSAVMSPLIPRPGTRGSFLAMFSAPKGELKSDSPNASSSSPFFIGSLPKGELPTTSLADESSFAFAVARTPPPTKSTLRRRPPLMDGSTSRPFTRTLPSATKVLFATT